MEKLVIEIPEGDKFSTLIVTLQSGVERCIPLGSLYCKPEPSYNRQRVLCEAWYPTERGTAYFVIDSNDSIYKSKSDCVSCCNGNVYTPSLDLAEEIVKIRRGEWLPKRGDNIFIANKTNGAICSSNGIFEYRPIIFDFTESMRHNSFYFPSSEQRDIFISKQKKEEPKPHKSISPIMPCEREIGNSDKSLCEIFKEAKAFVDEVKKAYDQCALKPDPSFHSAKCVKEELAKEIKETQEKLMNLRKAYQSETTLSMFEQFGEFISSLQKNKKKKKITIQSEHSGFAIPLGAALNSSDGTIYKLDTNSYRTYNLNSKQYNTWDYYCET